MIEGSDKERSHHPSYSPMFQPGEEGSGSPHGVRSPLTSTNQSDDDGIITIALNDSVDNNTANNFPTNDDLEEVDGGHHNSINGGYGSRIDLKTNFILFSLLYSLVHGAVDAVLAFSAAELGTDLGSWGGFTLYMTYTFSALFLAKPLLQIFEAKDGVSLGLLGLLIYVSGFYLAILFPEMAWFFFLCGAGIGGIGAGVLWTSQGAYYTINSSKFAFSVNRPKSEVITVFAAIFAGFYLAFETGFKFMGTIVFLADSASNHGQHHNWKPIVFGLYTFSAAIATIVFFLLIRQLEDHDHQQDSLENYQHQQDTETEEPTSPQFTPATRTSNSRTLGILGGWKTGKSTGNRENRGNSRIISGDKSRSSLCCGLFKLKERLQWNEIFYQTSAVTRVLLMVPKLQLLIPYQVCFGFSAGLVETYVNGVIVNKLIGDGYIGLLSGTVSLTASLLAGPMAWVCNNVPHGRVLVMILGIFCFAMGGLFLICLSDEEIASWSVILWYYVLHGAARGVWENTNKALIADFFPSSDMRDAAFASVYFSSGLAGAMGFIFFQFMSRYSIAVANLVTSLIALICYLFAQRLQYQEEDNEALLSSIRKLTDSSEGYDRLEVDSDGGEDAPFSLT
jgi:MFS family permease